MARKSIVLLLRWIARDLLLVIWAVVWRTLVVIGVVMLETVLVHTLRGIFIDLSLLRHCLLFSIFS